MHTMTFLPMARRVIAPVDMMTYVCVCERESIWCTCVCVCVCVCVFIHMHLCDNETLIEKYANALLQRPPPAPDPCVQLANMAQLDQNPLKLRPAHHAPPASTAKYPPTSRRLQAPPTAPTVSPASTRRRERRFAATARPANSLLLWAPLQPPPALTVAAASMGRTQTR